ncbi:MAG TPA: ATP-binding protein [Nocardioidaceae bacterium]|nr:ATP-binding protein [Nocardioidaceae bacterium]
MSGELEGSGRRRFPPRSSSVREARRMIRECLVEAGREDLVDTAELLVSEIVTNALVHAGTYIDVAFTFVSGGLRVEVTDGSPHAPTVRGYGPSAGTGRGLMLLEQMVDDWGVVPDEPGKTVWFQIAAGGGPSERSEGPLRAQPRAAQALDVQLLDVPLLLHEAWRQHAESLLREYLLATLDEDSADDPIIAHAQASDAIALLAEHIPPSGVTEDPDEVMVTATEPLVTSPLVEIPVPVASVQHFATLERTIVTALDMAEGGLLLTPPTQPEVQGLRAWLCGQVLSQSEGASPVPWSSTHDPVARYVHTLAWDTGPVRDSAVAMLAVDDEDRIVAASARALELLGYDATGGLVGRRLVTMIPERYRQAHLAGFTLHFLTGRATLVGRPVVVPALRREGDEVEVEMTIRTDRAGDGRTVFVAELSPVA